MILSPIFGIFLNNVNQQFPAFQPDMIVSPYTYNLTHFLIF